MNPAPPEIVIPVSSHCAVQLTTSAIYKMYLPPQNHAWPNYKWEPVINLDDYQPRVQSNHHIAQNNFSEWTLRVSSYIKKNTNFLDIYFDIFKLI